MEISMYAVVFFAGAGWGMWISEFMTKIQKNRATHNRVIVDMPFSKEQAQCLVDNLMALNKYLGQQN